MKEGKGTIYESNNKKIKFLRINLTKKVQNLNEEKISKLVPHLLT